jgi:hypothetical protein
MALSPIRQGQLADLVAALLFGISAPLALLAVRLLRGTEAETPMGGVIGPVALVLGSPSRGRWCSARAPSLEPTG